MLLQIKDSDNLEYYINTDTICRLVSDDNDFNRMRENSVYYLVFRVRGTDFDIQLSKDEYGRILNILKTIPIFVEVFPNETDTHTNWVNIKWISGLGYYNNSFVCFYRTYNTNIDYKMITQDEYNRLVQLLTALMK